MGSDITIWVITILGAIVFIGGGCTYVWYQTGKEVDDKIWVFVRTLAGKTDDFLARIEDNFIDMPSSRSKYVKALSDFENLRRHKVKAGYIYKEEATTTAMYPSQRGILSFLSRPIKQITYNEGDPNPIGRTFIKEDGTIGHSDPVDTALASAIYMDKTTIVGLGIADDEVERQKKLNAQWAKKYINPLIPVVFHIIELGFMGGILYFLFMLMDKLEYLIKGEGL